MTIDSFHLLSHISAVSGQPHGTLLCMSGRLYDDINLPLYTPLLRDQFHNTAALPFQIYSPLCRPFDDTTLLHLLTIMSTLRRSYPSTFLHHNVSFTTMLPLRGELARGIVVSICGREEQLCYEIDLIIEVCREED